MSDLYDGCNVCRDLADVESGFIFDLNVIETALKRIYEADFNPMTDIEETLYRETMKSLNEAVDKGVSMSTFTPEAEFINALKTNNEVFAAFKVHRFQNDVAAQLLDENGKLKPFNKWFSDIKTIADHHIVDWGHTEHDTAVIRAHQATDWQQFEAEKDVLPNLEWMPTTSVIVGEDHRPFWGVIYPVDSAKWNEHRPGDRWRCKCHLQATDKKPNLSDLVADNKVTASPGLDNNPGIDKHIFSESHPYFTQAYSGARKAVKNFLKIA